MSIPTREVSLFHYRVDREYSNSYEVWKAMGSPQNPTTEQYQELEDIVAFLKTLTDGWEKENE